MEKYDYVPFEHKLSKNERELKWTFYICFDNKICISMFLDILNDFLLWHSFSFWGKIWKKLLYSLNWRDNFITPNFKQNFVFTTSNIFPMFISQTWFLGENVRYSGDRKDVCEKLLLHFWFLFSRGIPYRKASISRYILICTVRATEFFINLSEFFKYVLCVQSFN